MWLDNLKELKKSKGMTSKQISVLSGIPESTIKRILAGDTEDPCISTIHRIVETLGSSLDQIFADTHAVIATARFSEMKQKLDALEAENAKLIAENDVLRMKLEHKEEIISLHNYYKTLLTK